ncbi:hypothetical protein MKX01_008416 [Papaver californicum]|nr:hypothetical protein MKX01_008416 [Papaver californicum]
MPTAPWMKGPILIPSDEVLDLSRIRKLNKNFNNRDDWSLTDKIRGGRGKQAMRKIVESITKLDDLTEKEGPLPQKEVEGYDLNVPLEEVIGEEEGDSRINPRMPWVLTQKVVFRRTKKERVVTAAELGLPEFLLKKLKCDARKIKKWVKVPKAGVTEAVVDEINVIWKRGELAMVKFEIVVGMVELQLDILYYLFCHLKVLMDFLYLRFTLILIGKNTKLQGLAAAIIKLWEKTHIVKIAVKLGVPNTNNEQMAWEIKRLTGGVLILRNKFFIIYRGKDFVPPRVASLIVSRETELKHRQVEEEGARQKALESFHATNKEAQNNCTVGTFSDFRDIQAKYGLPKIGHGVVDVEKEAEKERLEKELRMQKQKLEILQVKIEKSNMELAKLNSSWTYAELAVDHEMITQEEKQCLRKIGLKMSKTLVLGRRGIFDGVIESIHQHWKHREIVKVITMQPEVSQVNATATWLERESHGILVGIKRLRKGHAIILYRGKNYKRPPKIQSGNLLTKRAALQRSLEMQRVGFFAYQRMRTISELELKLKDLQKRDEKVTATYS